MCNRANEILETFELLNQAILKEKVVCLSPKFDYCCVWSGTVVRCVRGAPEVCRVGETRTEFTSFIASMQFLCMLSYKFMRYDNFVKIYVGTPAKTPTLRLLFLFYVNVYGFCY